MSKDRRLGKGLAALLGTPLEEELAAEPAPSTPSRPATQAASQSAPQPNKANREAVRKVSLANAASSDTATDSGTINISVYEVDNNPFQPRRKFNEEEIAALAESIREHQQLQPILVRKHGDRYQLISGERRLRATIHAGLTTIRAEVREADDRLVAELAIVENLQRKDLDAIEKAMSFRRYIDEHTCTQDDLAKRLKIDRSTIANLMRLLELPPEIQQAVQAEDLTAGHARALLPLGDEDQQVEFAKVIKEESWSVRETERRVAEQLEAEDGIAGRIKPTSGRKRQNPQIAAIEKQLRLAFGTKTEIKQNANGKGKITISFANADEFDRLCQLICPELESKAA